MPFFGELKLFEMPLLGFLGFPPFAVECYVMYNFISLFRHRRGWEQDNYGLNRHKKISFKVAVILVVLFVAFSATAFYAIDSMTVNSYVSYITDHLQIS